MLKKEKIKIDKNVRKIKENEKLRSMRKSRVNYGR
jgi:hypothetical protein